MPSVRILILAGMTAFAACAGPGPRVDAGRGGVESFRTVPLQYPYVAPKERADQIRQNHAKVRPGMTPTEVVELLGEADETGPLFEPRIWNPKRVGTSYKYVLEQRRESGSVNEVAARWVRVYFGPDDLVTRVVPIEP